MRLSAAISPKKSPEGHFPGPMPVERTGQILEKHPHLFVFVLMSIHARILPQLPALEAFRRTAVRP